MTSARVPTCFSTLDSTFVILVIHQSRGHDQFRLADFRLDWLPPLSGISGCSHFVIVLMDLEHAMMFWLISLDSFSARPVRLVEEDTCLFFTDVWSGIWFFRPDYWSTIIRRFIVLTNFPAGFICFARPGSVLSSYVCPICAWISSGGFGLLPQSRKPSNVATSNVSSRKLSAGWKTYMHILESGEMSPLIRVCLSIPRANLHYTCIILVITFISSAFSSFSSIRSGSDIRKWIEKS